MRRVVASVHLLGAAIDRSSVAANTTFGKDIDKLVGDFYNLRNSEDNMLSISIDLLRIVMHLDY